MPWNLKNVALDPAYAMQRRTAPKMDMEPSLGGVRIRLRQMITISDDMYERNKDRIAQLAAQGVLTAEQVRGSKKAPEPAAASKPEPAPEPTPAPAPEPEPEPVAPPPLPTVDTEDGKDGGEDETPVETPTAAKKRKSKKGFK